MTFGPNPSLGFSLISIAVLGHWTFKRNASAAAVIKSLDKLARMEHVISGYHNDTGLDSFLL